MWHSYIAPRNDGMYQVSLWQGEDSNGVHVYTMMNEEELSSLGFQISTAQKRMQDGDTYEKIG